MAYRFCGWAPNGEVLGQLVTSGKAGAARAARAIGRRSRWPRPPEQLCSFFDGLQFVEPGFGPVPLWRPDLDTQDDVPSIATTDPGPDAPWGGVARKP